MVSLVAREGRIRVHYTVPLSSLLCCNTLYTSDQLPFLLLFFSVAHTCIGYSLRCCNTNSFIALVHSRLTYCTYVHSVSQEEKDGFAQVFNCECDVKPLSTYVNFLLYLFFSNRIVMKMGNKSLLIRPLRD